MVLKERGISPVGVYRINAKSKPEKRLVLAITKLVQSAEFKKSKTAHKNLLKLGKKLSQSRSWKIKGVEVKTFLNERDDVM